MGRLQSKRCVITGASSGIGRAAALRFAQEGAVVAVLDVDGDAAEEVVREITSGGGTASSHAVDISSEESTAAAIAAAQHAMGGVDVCWANAGTGDQGTVLSTSLDHWNRILQVNLTGMFLTAKHVLPHLVEAGGGSLMFTSSSGVLTGTPGVASNMAAKGGVLGMTRQIAADFVGQQIRANAICPGPTRTYALLSAYAEMEKARGLDAGALTSRLGADHPRGRIAEPEDIANVALFLASDESTWVNAQFINVSGTGH
jgi:NAD(P)-dependent dehydrogenase (short-subunit alcohol dehydrogenase family)